MSFVFGERTTGGRRNIVKIRVIVITYSEDEQNGWIDSLNVANRIKIGLKRDPIIDDRFQIDDESFETSNQTSNHSQNGRHTSRSTY
ncbi:hypothetical protein ACFSND_21970 [Brevibacillus brevis]|uniref:hypothetical protein n=1 Tax=Brevibacillus brevis TaxID=1393 RepID=UPI0036368D06